MGLNIFLALVSLGLLFVVVRNFMMRKALMVRNQPTKKELGFLNIGLVVLLLLAFVLGSRPLNYLIAVLLDLIFMSRFTCAGLKDDGLAYFKTYSPLVSFSDFSEVRDPRLRKLEDYLVLDYRVGETKISQNIPLRDEKRIRKTFKKNNIVLVG